MTNSPKKGLTFPSARDIYRAMAKHTETLTELLKRAIASSGLTFTDIQRATGVQRASLLRFMRGETSLRLDKADDLAEYFGIESRLKGK